MYNNVFILCLTLVLFISYSMKPKTICINYTSISHHQLHTNLILLLVTIVEVYQL
jgi:hypothetical protein